MVNGSEMQVSFQNPFAWLCHVCEESIIMRDLIRDMLLEKHNTPGQLWNIVLYQDGVDPGDTKVKEKGKHSIIFYWSFLEFGFHNLCREELWGSLVVMRTHKAKLLAGGVTELTHHAIKMFHNQERDMAITGVTLPLGDRTTKIFAKVNMIFADKPAIAEMLSSKGHSGVKPCPLCMNATNHKPPGCGTPMHEASSYCVPITCTDFERFKKHTNASLRKGIANLNAAKGTMSQKKFENLESDVYGFSWNPFSIITEHAFHLQLDVADAIMYDWGHCYVCDGIADHEFGMYMKVMHTAMTQHGFQHSCTYSNLGEYLATWTWPQHHGNNGKFDRYFDKEHATRYIRSGDFAATSSEYLTMAPVICRFLSQVGSRGSRDIYIYIYTYVFICMYII